MTIKPHQEWGTDVDRPADLEIVGGDAELARRFDERPHDPIAVRAGDLHRTIGARPLADRRTLRSLPLDLLRVRLDGAAPITAVAHVVARSPWSRGGWWRGPVSVVMNAEFLGDWDVATRGHPNDGRAERFDLAADVGVRQRRANARRLPTGTHLPHPGIARRPGVSHTLEFERPRHVWIDGVRRGVARLVEVTVDADAATLLA